MADVWYVFQGCGAASWLVVLVTIIAIRIEGYKEADGPDYLGVAALEPLLLCPGPDTPIMPKSVSVTRSTWASVNSGKKGSASERREISSHTGNSPSRWSKRSR